MSAGSEESLKKDDNDGKSDSDGDFFDKIRSLLGDAICEALQSKLFYSLGEHAHLKTLSLKISNIVQSILWCLRLNKHRNTTHFKLFVGHF